MAKNELDYEPLQKIVNKKPESVKLGNKVLAETVKNRMRKIAFDVYNVENDPYDGLWKLESLEDGKEYLVRMEAQPGLEDKTGGWSATSNSAATSITIAYKNIPITKISNKNFDFNKDDIYVFKQTILQKIAADNRFRKLIVNLQSDEKRKEIMNLFPELFIA